MQLIRCVLTAIILTLVFGVTGSRGEVRPLKTLSGRDGLSDILVNTIYKDYVPYWDFDDPAGKKAPRDASAAAVVASALLELQGYCDKANRQRYYKAAQKMLASLSSAKYQSRDKRPSFLDHSTGHKPAGSEIDASIIYADYYYLEALLRLKRVREHNAPLPELALK